MLRIIRSKSRKLTMILAAITYSFCLIAPPLAIAQEATETTPIVEEAAPEPTPEATAPTETTTPVTPGPQSPTGPEAPLYTLNPETGKYESEQYVWDPATRQTAPKQPQTYSYNPETERWDTEVYYYAPELGKYVPQTQSVDQPPAEYAAKTSQPDNPAAESSSNYTPALLSSTPLSLSTENPGPGSLSVTQYDSNSSGFFDLYFNADISHTVNSTATTGDASVLHNTTAGSALSGDATAMANILNMVQSAWGVMGTLPNIFTADIQGDYYGDIIIDPGMFDGMTTSTTNELDVNVASDVAIENNVNLLAQSGDATVSGNTTAGDATSGDATALANIINLIQSSIAANQSFLGILNVNGDLEGDVLMSEDILDQLIAANIPQTQLTLGGDTSIVADLNDSQTINNQINTTASTGNAAVTNNTTGGNATSGNAETNVTVFNLTGRQVVGTNALLVFVNVGGQWVGFITDAPGGATAAALGSGISENTTTSTEANYNVDSTAMIRNNINVTAETGNAEVSNNTTGGSATSGNASASANVSNIVNSSFSLAGWFGMLFINVLGNWFGSFGTNTAFGNTVPTPASKNSTSQTAVANAYLTSPASEATAASSTPPNRQQPKVRVYSAEFQEDERGQVVLASVTETTPPTPPASQNATSQFVSSAQTDFTTLGLLSLIAVAFVAIFYGDRFTAILRRSL